MKISHVVISLIAAMFCCVPQSYSYTDEASITNDAQEIAGATSEKGQVWRCGFIDKTGKLVIPDKFEGCRPFSEGLAAVRLEEKWGFIDLNGNLKIPATFDDAEPFHDGFAAVRTKSKYGFIDASGKLVIKPQFHSAKQFSEGLAFVETAQNKWSCIDKAGKVQFSLGDNVSRVDDFREGFAVVHGSSTAEYRNKKGEKVLSGYNFHSLPFSERLASVAITEDGWSYKQGFIDPTGKVVIEPKYRRAGSFSEGFASFCLGEFEGSSLPSYPLGKWGFLTHDGKTVIEAKFDDAANFHEGMAQILMGKEGLTGYINSKGEEIVPAKYSKGFDFSDGLALVREGIQWKFLDKQGNVAFTNDSYVCGSFHEGRALVANMSDHVLQEKWRKAINEVAMPIHAGFDPRD